MKIIINVVLIIIISGILIFIDNKTLSYEYQGNNSELKHFYFYKISQSIEKWSFFCQIFNLGIA